MIDSAFSRFSTYVSALFLHHHRNENLVRDTMIIDDKIAALKSKLMYTKKAREHERQRFTENQSILAQRQHFYLNELEKLQQPKVAMAPYYLRVMNDHSRVDESPYVISRETELCKALHQVEVTTNQWRLVVKHHENMVSSLNLKLQEERKRSEEIEDELLRSIKFSSIDMTGIIVENRAIINNQRRHVSHLKGEISDTDDSSIDICDMQVNEDFSDTMSSDSICVRKRENEENQSVNIEKRIIEVCSYFGVKQTAIAA